jgi:predicted transcriptional regulator
MINQLSLLAYRDYVQPNLTKRQEQVLEAIEKIQPCCNQQIAEKLNWPINMITGRVKELRDKGELEMHHQALYKFGKKVNFWATRVWMKTC